MRPSLKLLISILVSLLAGGIGSIFTYSAIPEWYAHLARPALTPPSWVFGPVWTTLFILMGIAAFLVWQKGQGRREAKIALTAFVIQLALNALWSIVFFGLRSPGGALVEVVFLWAAIVATIILFARVSRAAAWLLAPYILWASFAAYLTYQIWVLNV